MIITYTGSTDSYRISYRITESWIPGFSRITLTVHSRLGEVTIRERARNRIAFEVAEAMAEGARKFLDGRLDAERTETP